MGFVKFMGSSRVFVIMATVFVISMATAVGTRGGKDLKVGLFGVEQTLQKRSPYDNPTDPKRPLFRYAPGFAILQRPFLLKARMVAPFEFEDITPSVFAWYAAGILSLALSMLILLRLIPAASAAGALRNLRLSLLMAMPLIGYELANGQNKLMALFFMLLAIFLFEKKRMFLAALSFNLALTIYIPLFTFILYFILRGRGRFIVSFIAGAAIIFFILPSLVFGPGFNAFLLKDWLLRCLKPFFSATTYTTYIDLRTSSQSLPSAIGRVFTIGHTHRFQYFISPLIVHGIIRVCSTLIVLLSCLAVWKRDREVSRGLGYALFLILALILPSYCIYYTWAWLFVIYFAVLNYMSFEGTPARDKKVFKYLIIILFISSWLISVHLFNHLSLLFWATLLMWVGLFSVLKRAPVPKA